MKHELSWPQGNWMIVNVNKFRDIYSLPEVVGAIDKKPKISTKDYFYFKSSSYTLQCEDVVDRSKKSS